MPVNNNDPYGLYNQQAPGQAFTRYLAQLQGGAGKPFTSPVRNMMEERGQYQANLAPLFGYGIGQDIGGKGTDFAEFWKSGGADKLAMRTNMPNNNTLDIREALNNSLGYLNDKSLEGLDEDKIDKTTAQGQQQLYGMAQRGALEDPEDQRRALQSALALQVNPYFRGGLMRGIGRLYDTQQSTDSGTSFLQYAKSKGWF